MAQRSERREGNQAVQVLRKAAGARQIKLWQIYQAVPALKAIGAITEGRPQPLLLEYFVAGAALLQVPTDLIPTFHLC